MKRYFLFMVAGFLSLVSQGQSFQDNESVKKVVMNFQEDFNDGRFRNAMTYSAPEWRHINPGGGIDKGRDSVLKTVRSVHQSFLKGVTMSIESMEIRFITSDVAIADVVHKVSTYITPDGVKHENERHIKTYVIVQKKGTWLLVQDNNTIIQGSNTASKQN
jgi:uncharacterized protein (TIGR02246 family)